jgi:hypothetical protein
VSILGGLQPFLQSLDRADVLVPGLQRRKETGHTTTFRLQLQNRKRSF